MGILQFKEPLALLLATGLIGNPATAQSGEGVSLLGGRLQLPPGEVADALSSMPAADPAAWRAEPWPRWELPAAPGADAAAADPWALELPWRTWVECVRAEASRHDPSRRARLAQLARLQTRDADAWRHLARIREPGLTYALLPLFLPGVPSAHLGSRALPEGVLLRPALPPPSDASEGSLRSLVQRPMRVERVRIGESLVALQVVVEADGVQVELTHQAGPPVEVRVQPPVPPGVVLALLYANWERVEDPGAAVTLRLEDTEEGREAALWGRFRPREERWPRPRPGSGPAEISPRAPLELVHASPVPARLVRFGEALEELFSRPCRLSSGPRAPSSDELYEPIRLHFGAGQDRSAFSHKLRSMISLAESWALAARAEEE